MAPKQLKEARELLALRDSATKNAHHVHVYAGEELICNERGEPIGSFESQADGEFFGAAHRMADWIQAQVDAVGEQVAPVVQEFKLSQEWIDRQPDDSGAYCPHGFMVGCPVCSGSTKPPEETVTTPPPYVPDDVRPDLVEIGVNAWMREGGWADEDCQDPKFQRHKDILRRQMKAAIAAILASKEGGGA